MDQIHRIRQLYYEQGLTNLSEIARQTGLDWKTVSKYARQAGLGNQITPAGLRTYAAAACLREGLGPETVRQRMGYESDFAIRQILRQIGQEKTTAV